MTEDEEYLKWLSIAHYVVGVLYALFILAMFGFMAVSFGMMGDPGRFPRGGSGNPPPEMFFGMMATFLVFGLLWSLAVLVCIFLTGRFLAQRKHYVFCFVIAALNCMWAPFGTVLGVFTIIVLSRPAVKVMFGRVPPPDGAGGVAVSA